MTARPYLISALGAALLLSACGESKEAAAPTVKMAPATDRLPIRAQVVSDIKPVPATLTTRDMAEARARISGTLVALSVKEGDVVRQGQLIGRVKDDRLTLQTGAFDAQVAAAAAEASRAQRGASAELGAQGAILAPATGRILVADVPVGSVVMPGQSVARITAGPLVVRIELPEGQARTLKVGDFVDLAAEDLRGVAARGTIAQIYPSITGGQVTADVTAPNLPGDLIGQRVRAAVKIGERQAIIIPRRYVATRFGVDYARLVGTDGAISESPIQTRAGATADTVEILSGLRLGDVLTPAEGAR